MIYQHVTVNRSNNYGAFVFSLCDESGDVITQQHHSFELQEGECESQKIRLLSSFLHQWFDGGTPVTTKEIDLAVMRYNGITQEVHKLLGELAKTHINSFTLSFEDGQIMFKYEKLSFKDVT